MLNATALPVRQVDEDVYVAPQLAPHDMAAAVAAGFRSVINNRPDYEESPAQPTSAAIEAAARAAGLAYRYLPVSPSQQTPEDAAAMARLLQELPRPLLIFCRSGARSTRLYRLAIQA